MVNLAFSEMSSAANMAFSMYPGLTHGAYSAIHAGGSHEQKDLYLPKLASGQWGGTMNLTEPQCGTDLGLLRTKAVPQATGPTGSAARRSGFRGGEHDLTENIVHLVLARIEGAPAGTRGISLFIVPKFLPDADGNPGARNAVKCLGLEEKMGIHGNATCVIGHEEATGWLIGEENRGLLDHVRDDERGPPGRRHAGHGPGRGRLPGRRRLRQGPAAGPLAHRARRTPTVRPIRSSSTRTCAAC